jgi:hypothetical protein
MNQRRRPMQRPMKSQSKPEWHWRRWHYWRRHPYYYDYYWYDYDYDYYDYWDYDYWDYDYYHGESRPQRAGPRRPREEDSSSHYFKIEPMLMASLLDYAFKEIQSEDQIQSMLDKMTELKMSADYLDMSHYDEIVGSIVIPEQAEVKEQP